MSRLVIIRLSCRHDDVVRARAFIKQVAGIARQARCRCAVNLQYAGSSATAAAAPLLDGRQRQLPHSHVDQAVLSAIKDEAVDCGLTTLCSPYDEEAVDRAVAQRFDYLKLESYQFADWPLLERIARARLPIVACADGNDAETISRVSTFLNNRNVDFTLLRSGAGNIDAGNSGAPPAVPFATRLLACAGEDGVQGSFLRLLELHGQRRCADGGGDLWELAVELPLSDEAGFVTRLQSCLAGGAPSARMSETAVQTGSLLRTGAAGDASLKRGVYLQRSLPRGTRLDADNMFCALAGSETQLLAEDLSKYMVYTLRADLAAGAPVTADVVTSQNLLERGDQAKAGQIECSEKSIAGVECLGYSSRNSSGGKVVLHMHGGGYVSGSPRESRGSALSLASEATFDVVSVGYRLAPSNPYPAAAEDVLAVYRALLAGGLPSSAIGFYGESAGGGLALAVAMMLRDRGEPLPAAVVCSSPWADLTNTGSGHSEAMNALDITLKTGFLNENARDYAGGESLRSPYLSPVFGDFSGFPPLLVYAGEREILAGDAETVAEKARASGVAVRLQVVARMPHVFTAMTGVFAEADAAVQEIKLFFENRLCEQATKLTC